MERKKTQKSTLKSNFFQIPIKDYEKDMERESSKIKKKEILELFTTYNKLRSEDEFDEIKFELHDACIEGDLETIKILLSETIENSSNTLTFKIDETNQTALLFKVNNDIEELIIPRTVKHESIEYLITSIKSINCNAKKIKFSEDSAVQTFYKNAFYDSNIEEIYFPRSLKELKEGWCGGTNNLIKIVISPSNCKFKFKDDRYLISKSESNNNEFDTILFVRRDIEEFSIPSNIKIISSHAFSDCENLHKVEIPTNSNLETIESNAFSSSNIESISIPPKVSKICESTFSLCENLKKVEIPINSNLQTIESFAFYYSLIESIFIPSKVSKICEYAFNGCKNLKKVKIPTNSNLETIESSAFSSSNIESIFIPPKVLKICEFAFSYCKNLKKVEIPTNSNLQTIESSAFSSSNIESIFIPSKVSNICEYAFSSCKNIQIIEISEESKLELLSSAFEECKRSIIMIPSSLRKLINTNDSI